jgi:hypothetical protein
VSFSVVFLAMVNVDPDAVAIKFSEMKMHRNAPIKAFFGLILQQYHVVDARLPYVADGRRGAAHISSASTIRNPASPSQAS